jgi:hypothetical protein
LTLASKIRTRNIQTIEQLVDWCVAGLEHESCGEFVRTCCEKWYASRDPHLRFVKEFLSTFIPGYHAHAPWFRFLSVLRGPALSSYEDVHAYTTNLRTARLGVPAEYWCDVTMCLEFQARLPENIVTLCRATAPTNFASWLDTVQQHCIGCMSSAAAVACVPTTAPPLFHTGAVTSVPTTMTPFVHTGAVNPAAVSFGGVTTKVAPPAVGGGGGGMDVDSIVSAVTSTVMNQLASMGVGGGGGEGTNTPTGPQCFECKGWGHWARECPNRLRREKKENEKKEADNRRNQGGGGGRGAGGASSFQRSN